MDEGDILSIPARREVVREIIEGTRTKHLYEPRLDLGVFVEFFSAPLLHPPDLVESFPENDALRAMVRVTNITEGFLGKYFFHWTSAIPNRQAESGTTIGQEKYAILDAIRRFSEGTVMLIPAFPVSKVTGIPLQVVEDQFELLAREDYLKYSYDSSGHYAVLSASGRQYLRLFDQRVMNERDTEVTALPEMVSPINFAKTTGSLSSEKATPTTNSHKEINVTCGSEYQIVILVHGIRTQAEWQAMVREKIAVPDKIEVVPIKYGYFDALRFWFPFWTRRKPVEHVYTQIRVALQKARKSHPEARLSIIAHSFGTYVIGEILRRGFDLQVHRLILCGCVLPENYPWHQIQGRFDEDKVVNECGKADIWPVLAKSLSWGYGATGTHGFGAVLVKDRFHAGGHGQYFEPDFVARYWEPFLKEGVYEGTDFEVTMPATAWWVSMLGIFPLKWLIVLSLLAATIGAGYAATNLFRLHEQPSARAGGIPPKPVLPNDIDIASASFMEYEGDARAPRLDLKLTNMGSRAAFITRVKVNIKRSWRLRDLPEVPGVVVPPGHNYVVKLKHSDHPYSIVMETSEGIKPDDFGRFSLQFVEDPWVESNTIYLANAELVANSEETPYKTRDLIFLITQRGILFPDLERLNEMLAAGKSLGQNVNRSSIDQSLSENKRIISEVEKIDAVKNPALLKLIGSAKESSLGLH